MVIYIEMWAFVVLVILNLILIGNTQRANMMAFDGDDTITSGL
jgi:hypothetical protein